MWFRKKIPPTEKAQSLVEMAVITPILILMLIGLFEVGYALWGYMTLLNVDREATRFAIREGALDFSDNEALDYGSIGYGSVITHALVSNATQLELSDYLNNTGPDDPKATIIVTHMVIDTQKPCDAQDDDSNPNNNQCYADNPPDCSEATLAATDYTLDDLVLHPEISGHEHLRYVFPQTSTYQSRLTGAALTARVAELKLANDKFNCELAAKGYSGLWSNNSSITVEMFYEQPQLLGFPLLSWIANPIPMYVQTTMRIDSKDSGQCELYPILVDEVIINQMLADISTPYNLLGGSHPPGGFGWATWDPAKDSETYLVEEFQNIRLATNDYTDPTDASDHTLNASYAGDQDWIAGLNGVINSNAVRDEMTILLNNLIGRKIYIPVYDTISGGGANGQYHVIGFAQVEITSFALPPGLGGDINATIVDYPVDICPSD